LKESPKGALQACPVQRPAVIFVPAVETRRGWIEYLQTKSANVGSETRSMLFVYLAPKQGHLELFDEKGENTPSILLAPGLTLLCALNSG